MAEVRGVRLARVLDHRQERLGVPMAPHGAARRALDRAHQPDVVGVVVGEHEVGDLEARRVGAARRWGPTLRPSASRGGGQRASKKPGPWPTARVVFDRRLSPEG